MRTSPLLNNGTKGGNMETLMKKIEDWALDAVKDLPPLLNKKEAAEFLRRSVSTLDRAIGNGSLHVVQSAPGSYTSSPVLIPRLSLARYLQGIEKEPS